VKTKRKEFVQHLYHDIDDEILSEKYLDATLPLIGLVVMYFNGLESSLDSALCEIFTDRTDSIGLIVLHRMSYSAKVELFKRFGDDFHLSINQEIDNYNELLNNLKEAGRLRNLVAHANWENTDNDGFTYVKFKISKRGMEQEYVQFSEDSLNKIIDLIFTTRSQLSSYEEAKEELLANW
jgi:hypothetical protein